MNELLDVLRRNSLLMEEDEATHLSFAELASCRTFPRGNILFHHEDPCLAAYMVLSGSLKLVIAGEDGRELELDRFGPGDVCGLIATVDGGPHTGTAITTRPSRIAILPRERLAAWLAERPLLQGRVLLEMAHLLRLAYDRVRTQSLLSVKLRVRAALLDLARTDGMVRLDDVVVARPTHQEIAERVGSTRVVVSRAIKTLLEEEDSIRMEGRILRVRLKDVDPDTSHHGTPPVRPPM